MKTVTSAEVALFHTKVSAPPATTSRTLSNVSHALSKKTVSHQLVPLVLRATSSPMVSASLATIPDPLVA